MSFVSKDYTYMTVNSAYIEYYSTNYDEILGRRVSDFIDEAIFKDSIKPHLDLCFDGKLQNYDCRVNFKGKPEVKWMRMLYTPAYDDTGSVIGAISHGIDITLEKLKEENRLIVELPYNNDNNEKHYLKDELYRLVSEKKEVFDFLQAGSLDGIWYWDLLEQENEWMSPRFWELLGYNPLERKHSPSEWQDLIQQEDLKTALSNFKKHLEDPNHPYDQEVRYKHKNGSTVWVRCRGIAIRDKNGTPVRMLGAHTDITRLKEAMLEKERLMKEANHRIKNNLLMISSLIQINHDTDEAHSSLEKLKNHINGIGFIHDQLSKIDNFNMINSELFLKQLLNNIESIYSGMNIMITHSLESIEFESKTAVHLGIIINELFANSIKHARIEGEKLEIYITLAKTPDAIILFYKNTGKTFPYNFEEAVGKSTGLLLVKSLTEGLNGKITLARKEYTEFKIELKN